MSKNPLEALALFVGSNLAAHADMRNRRHEDQKASGQRDVAGDARALLGDRLLGDLNQDFLAWLQQVTDDRQIGGLHGAARRPATIALASRCAPLVHGGRGHRDRALLQSDEPPRAGLRRPRVLPLRLLAIKLRRLFFAVLVVEVQLDAVIEVSFLQHLTQFAGANLGLKRLLFLILVQIVLIGLVVMMSDVEFLSFDDLFFDKAAARSKRGYRRKRRGPGIYRR